MESRTRSEEAGGVHLLIVSGIPVARRGDGWASRDLWARDLEAQVGVVGAVGLVAPEGVAPDDLAPLPDAVQIVLRDSVTGRAAVDALVGGYDVVQVGSGQALWRAGPSLRFARAARRSGRCLILGVSSNRAATTAMNARGRSFPRRARARVEALGIAAAERRLVRLADGVFATGHGVAEALGNAPSDLHVGIASWIRREDVIDDAAYQARVEGLSRSNAPPLRLCVAARLEPMKGVHLAVEALRTLSEGRDADLPTLTILGRGSEREHLERLVAETGLDASVSFGGTFAYPGPFLSEIRRHDVMLLTNLNVEQPRLIFDAISQGLVPVCPDSAPYRALALDPRVLYRRGDAGALANTVAGLEDRARLCDVLAALRPLAERYTIESMHEARAAWVVRLLRDRRAGGARETPPRVRDAGPGSP